MNPALITGILIGGSSLLSLPTSTKAPEIGLMYLYRTPLTQWQCTTSEHREYHGACKHREWSERNLNGHRNK